MPNLSDKAAVKHRTFNQINEQWLSGSLARKMGVYPLYIRNSGAYVIMHGTETAYDNKVFSTVS